MGGGRPTGLHFSVQGLVGLVCLFVLMVRVSEVAGGLTATKPEFSVVTEKSRLSTIFGADDYSRIKIFQGLRDLVLVLGPNNAMMGGVGSWQEARKPISGAGNTTFLMEKARGNRVRSGRLWGVSPDFLCNTADGLGRHRQREDPIGGISQQHQPSTKHTSSGLQVQGLASAQHQVLQGPEDLALFLPTLV